MNGRTALEDMTTLQRQQRALELRVQGWPFYKIAAELGYNDQSAARKAYRAGLKAAIPKQELEEMRRMSEARLDTYRMALSPMVGDPLAVMALLKAEEHQAKLYGLYQEATAASAAPIVIYEYPAWIGRAVDGELAQVTSEASQ